MFRLLFLLFVLIPIIEISVLMQVGAWLGFWPTLALVIFTAWLGAAKVKEQGISTLNSVQQKLAMGEMPSDDIIAGVCLLVAGVLLVTPGFVTDFLGLALLMPVTRQLLVQQVKQHIVVSAHFNQFQQKTEYKQSPFEETHHSQHKGTTIDGEFTRKN